MTTIELFLKLVRNALWQTEEELPKELTANMAANILRGGREQGLLGMVVDATIRNKIKMPEEQYLEFMVLLMKVKRSNEEVNEGLRRLKTLLDERGISFVVVKGQAVGAYFPDPMLRQAGDIDYYCDAENFPKALEAAREGWGIEGYQECDDHHVSFEYEGVTYEGHFALTRFYSKKKNRYWQQLVDGDSGCTVVINGMEVRTLSPTLHALYIFIHLYNHLMKQGISLRQFCDLAVMLHTCRGEIDRKRLVDMLGKLGMMKAYRVIGSILIDKLGMPPEDLGCELTDSDRKYTKRVFAIVRDKGNMGHYNLVCTDRGWRHRVELAVIKVFHFAKLWPIAPAYSCRWISYELTKKFVPRCGCSLKRSR